MGASLRPQIDALMTAGVQEADIFQEQDIKRVGLKRQELWRCTEALRTGDKLIVTGLQRLGHSLSEVLGTMVVIIARGADLRVIEPGIDTSDAGKQLIYRAIEAFWQLDREFSRQRLQDGLRAGRKGGRKPSFPPKVVAEAQRLMRDEGLTAYGAGRRLGINPSTVTKWKHLIEPVDDLTKTGEG